MGGPLDFSNVTSNAIAVQLSEQGTLERLLMMPATLGGVDNPRNVVYVPPDASALHRQFTDTLIRSIQAGLINKMEVVPEYRGNSFVPCKIGIKAWHTDKPGGFEAAIDIW
jgi:hypothetical protein